MKTHLDSKAENLGLKLVVVRQWQCLRLLPDTLPQSAIWSLVDIRHFSSALPLSSSVIETLYDLEIGLQLGLLPLQFKSLIT